MSINRRGDSWRARYRGPDGRERAKSFERKADAERWLATQRALIVSGGWFDPATARVPFGDLAEIWVAGLGRLTPKTAHQYRHLMTKHVLPRWRHVQLGKITTDAIEHWTTGLADAGLGTSGIRQSLSALSGVLDTAVRARRIPVNPARGVRIRKSRPAERVFLTQVEVERLAEQAGHYGTLIRVLAYTGLRFGEASALRVRDLDMARRRIRVVRAFSDVGGRLVEGSPKSHQARSVPIAPRLMPLLATLTTGRERDDLVFMTASGSAVRLSNWRAKFIRARDLAGLDKNFTPHGLRHTAASLFIKAGTPPKVLQMILGHASITMTLDLYGHLYPDEMDRWAERLLDHD